MGHNAAPAVSGRGGSSQSRRNAAIVYYFSLNKGPNCFISLGLVQGGGRISLAQYVKSQVRWSPPFHIAGEYFPTRCRALASIWAAELQPNPGKGKVWAERFPKGAKLSESRRQPAGFGQLHASLCRCRGSLASPGQAI